MELRLAEFDFSSHAPATLPARRAGSMTHSPTRPLFTFVTWAVEIEGDIPLLAAPVTVDD